MWYCGCADVGRAAARVRGAAGHAAGGAQPVVRGAARARPAALLPPVLHGRARARRPRLLLLQDAARRAQVRALPTQLKIKYILYTI